MNVSNVWLRRIMVPFCSLLLLVIAVLVPHVENRQRIRVAPGVWPGSEALMLAYAQKKLPTDKFQMVELPWSSAVMHALGNGAADVALMTLDGVLRLREGGQQLRVLMVLDESLGADKVMARSDIKKVTDLKGKTVGVDVRGVGAYLLFNALETSNMTMNDIHLVQMVQMEMKDAVEAGEVDAVVAAEPWTTGIRAAGLHCVFDSKQLSIPILRVLVTSEKALERFRPELTRLLKVQIEMNEVVRSGKLFDGAEMILRREGVRFEDFVSSQANWRPLNAERNLEMLAGDHPRIVQMAAAMEEKMLLGGLLRSRPVASAWIDATILREVLP